MKPFLCRIQPTRLGMLTGNATERESKIVAECFSSLQELVAKDVALMAERTLTADERTFGVVIFVAASAAEAEQLMRNDPAANVIATRYLDGHAAIDCSSEWLNLRVSRQTPPDFVTPTAKQNIDRLFDQVVAALTEYGVNKDWQLAIPDAPAIEITVEVKGQKLRSTSCHTLLEEPGNYLVTERGGEVVESKDHPAVLARQSAAFQRHRLAFEKILHVAPESAGALVAIRSCNKMTVMHSAIFASR